MKKLVSLQDIADEAGLSRSAVSLALRNDPSISAKTRTRVFSISKKLGYRPNPLVSALMSYRRGVKSKALHLSLALIDMEATAGRSRFLNLVIEGAKRSAAQHGYNFEVFKLHQSGISMQRLSRILYQRNISGIILSPRAGKISDFELDWEKFSVVNIGYSLSSPVLHRVDNYLYMGGRMAVLEAIRMGYQTPGFAVQSEVEEGHYHQWIGGFLLEQYFLSNPVKIPVFTPDREKWNFDHFRRWFKWHKPDVIICNSPSIILSWLKNMGKKIPADVGLVNLGLVDRNDSMSGVFYDHRRLGGVAVDFLVSMLHRGERGIGYEPQTLFINPEWNPGSTLKAQS